MRRSALLPEALFLLFALAFEGPGLLLPGGALDCDLMFQLLLLPGVVLYQLIEGRSGHVHLMKPLQVSFLQLDGLAHRGQPARLRGQLLGKTRQGLIDIEAQPGDALDHGLDRHAFDGLPDLGFAQIGDLIQPGARILAGLLDLRPHLGELVFNLGFGALPRTRDGLLCGGRHDA
jgi:hypothetical protein